MKEKILAELKKKYPGQSLRLLGLIADKLAKTVTEESAIEGAIAELEKLPVNISELGNILQKEADFRVTEAKKKWENEKKPKPNGKTDPDEDEDEDEDEEDGVPPAGKNKSKKRDRTPAWAKSLMEEIKVLKTEKVQGTIKSRLNDTLKDEVPESFYSEWALPEKEEDFEPFVEKVRKKHQEHTQELANKGWSLTTPPAGSSSAGGKVNEKAIVADITAWGARKKEEKEQQGKTATAKT